MEIMPFEAGQLAHLDDLAEQAREYAAHAAAPNTSKAYVSDWNHFAGWCEGQGIDPSVPNPQVVGLYIVACASGRAGSKPHAVSTIERRLAALSWAYRQRGLKLDRSDRHIATVLQGVRAKHARPPRQKEAILPEHLFKMLDALDPTTLRGMRDRAVLLIGFAGGLRRTEIVGLDMAAGQTTDGTGWIERMPDGLLLQIRGKTGWREVEIGLGSRPETCPSANLAKWLNAAQIKTGPVFRVVKPDGRYLARARMSDKAVARLVKRTYLAAGVHDELPKEKRALLVSGHSLRAGLASSAEMDERFIQKQLGHASAEMTRRYQRRRDRFKVNLSQAAGL